MPALTAIAFLSFIASALIAIFAVSQSQPAYFPLAVGIGVSGVLYLALNRVLIILTEIRDRITLQPANGIAAEPDHETGGGDAAVTPQGETDGQEYRGYQINYSGGVITAAGRWHNNVAEAKRYIDHISL